MIDLKPPLSAAQVRVPTFPSLAVEEPGTTVAREKLIQDLGAMLDRCDTTVNRNDRLTILIEACVGQGVDTVDEIIAIAGQLGFLRQHVGAMTRAGRRWRNDRGRLTLVP